MRKITLLLAAMLLCIHAFAQEWTILPTQGWAFEWRSMDERTEGPALTDENGDFKIYVRSLEQAQAAGNAMMDGSKLAGWDTQFFITFGEDNAMKIGDVMSVSFKIKADAPATFGTQSFAAPGTYLDWHCIGSVDATTSWTEITKKVTVEGDMDGMYSIAINLSDGQENNVYFKDIEVKVMQDKEVDSWTDIIVNGNMEGDNNECFYVTEQGIGGPFLANFTEGIGKDGSRAVKVESYDSPSSDWDTQFFIRLPYHLLPESKYRISFDYKADKVGDFETQSHTEPGGYIHWACVGSGTFTTEWKHFEAQGTISSDMSKEGQSFQTICFNLAKNKVRTNFFFDNVKFEVPTDVLATLTKNPAADPKPYTRPVYNSMAIVGDFLGLEGEAGWQPANGWAMTQDAENPAVWTLTKDFVAEAKTYEYKATANGKWGDYELPYVGNAEFDFDDPNLGAGEYSLTFTVDTRLHALNLDTKKLGINTYTATFTTNADYWTDVYAYAWSGEEPNVTKLLGDWPGTKLTPDGAGVYTVYIEAADAPEYIIFNNGNSGEGNQTADLPFINGAAYEFNAASGEEAPVKVAPEGWTNAVTNGNLAGDDVSSFVAKEYPSANFGPAVIYAGAGTNGSRGILVKTADETGVSGAEDWDSQFYIVMTQPMPEGTKIHVEFDYKASENAKVSTQAHGNPGAYQHWAAIGDVNFTTEWQTFSTEIEVDAAMAKGDNGNGSGTGLKSICFNLAVNKHAVEYHFDNFGVWYQKSEVITDPQVYTEFMAETGTLTYYYDDQQDERTGITELYDPIKYPDAVRFASYYNKVTKVVIDPSMKKAPLTSFRNMSYGGYDSETWTSYTLPNVTSIEGLENLNTEIVTDMNSMFTMYSNLTSIDVSSFNTSNVTNMNGMFLGCNKLQMLDLTSFDVSNVKDMRMMFGSCFELTTIYCEQDWSQIVPANNKLENMDNMYVMFSGCKKLVGGNGTTFDSNKINGTYARPDEGEEAPGYFTAEKPANTGDLNGDGKVDIADAVTVLNIMAAGEYKAEADINGDNKVDIADFVTILNIMAAQ